MNRLYKHAATAIIGLIVILGTTSLSFSREPYDKQINLISLNKAERFILHKIESDEVADLMELGDEESSRIISGNFLQGLLKHDNENIKIGQHGVRIKNALIKNSFDLELAVISDAVSLTNCRFLGNVEFNNSHFEKNLVLDGAVFLKRANFEGIKVEDNFSLANSLFANEMFPANFYQLTVGGNINITNSTFKGLATLRGAHIKGKLFASGTRFLNSKEDVKFSEIKAVDCDFTDAQFSGPVDFSVAQISKVFYAQRAQFLNPKERATFSGFESEYAFFTNATFQGPVNFMLAKFTESCLMNGARFLNKDEEVSFVYLNIGGNAMFSESEFNGPVNFTKAHIKGDFYLDKARLLSKKEVNFYSDNFYSINVEKDLYLTETEFNGPVNFFAAVINGKVDADNTIFEDNATFDDTIVSSDFFMRDAIIKKELSFFMADISGIFAANRTKFGGAVRFDNIKVGKKVIFDNASFFQNADFVFGHFSGLSIKDLPEKFNKIDLSNCKVDESVDLKNIHGDYLNLNSIHVTGRVTIDNVTVKNTLNLAYGVSREIEINNVNVGRLNLEYSSFQKIIMAEISWAKRGREGLLPLDLTGLTYNDISEPQAFLQLIDKSSFNLENYNQLEAFFAKAGNTNEANEVYIAGKHRELEHHPWWRRWVTKIFWEYLAGFGRKPLRVLLPSLFFIIVGAVVFDPKYLTGVHWPLHYRWFKVHRFISRILLSIEEFVPMVNLAVEKYWEPPEMKSLLLFYVYLHRFLGWIFIPIGLAAIASQIK